MENLTSCDILRGGLGVWPLRWMMMKRLLISFSMFNALAKNAAVVSKHFVYLC